MYQLCKINWKVLLYSLICFDFIDHGFEKILSVQHKQQQQKKRKKNDLYIPKKYM